MKKIFFMMMCVMFLLVGCDTILNLDQKPGAVERETTFKILLKDNTGNMQKIYGDSSVGNASIVLKSNTLGLEYKLISDENGEILINNITSDQYIISALRLMSEDEMEVLTGQKLDFYKLVNSSSGVVDLRADNHENIEIAMDKLYLESALVISEIYACGPPGSGLYYHDKYIEIYNQSDSVAYLDGLLIAVVYASEYLGLNYVDDPEFVHSKSIWKFPGTGKDYPINPGQYRVSAEDAIDHRINAPNSVDLSNVSFEFYKDDAPDIDNPEIPNMIKIYQSAGNDWLIGGKRNAIVLAQMDQDSLVWFDEQLLIPYKNILDGVEYLDDVTHLNEKTLNPRIDAGTTGGIQFYTGKTMERILIERNGKSMLKDDNNSSLDFKVYPHPSPEYHN